MLGGDCPLPGFPIVTAKPELPMKISVAMCTYNGERYLEEQVASILGQTRPPDEIVVHDDRSTDGTVAVLERLARNSAVPLRIAVNAVNLGSTRNFEGAINACSGDLIALADQDDVWVPEKLERMAPRFERDPALGALFSDSAVVDEQLRPLGFSMFEYCRFDARKRGLLDSGDLFDLVIHEPFVTGAALIFRADLRPMISPIPPGTDYMIHDRWIGIVAAAVSKLAYIDDKLILYRQHGRQQIGARIIPDDSKERRRRMLLRDPKLYGDYFAYLTQLKQYVARNLRQATHVRFSESLDARIAHLQARMDLAPARSGRVRPIMNELVSGRYRRFSNGPISAAKDFILK